VVLKEVRKNWVEPMVENHVMRPLRGAVAVGKLVGTIAAAQVASHYVINPILKSSGITMSNIDMGTVCTTAGFGLAYIYHLARGTLKHEASVVLSAASAVPAYYFAGHFDRLLRVPNPLTHISLTTPEIQAAYLTIGFGSGMLLRKIMRTFEDEEHKQST
jgi:hypothetical protein